MRRTGSAVLLVCLAIACSPPRLRLPSGRSLPFAGFANAYSEAVSNCRAARTMTATLSLSGTAGGTRLRGDVDAGFAAPADVRLEGRAPFGRPVFVFVARDERSAMLFLPRDNRILRDAPPDAIVEALTGVRLGPGELRAIVAGCGFGVDDPSAGREYDNGWVEIDLPAGDSYLRQRDGRWQIVAATRGPLTIEYDDYRSSRPATIRLRTGADSGSRTALTVRLSDVDINVPLGPEVFQVAVPPDAAPLTLDELRGAGPLGERTGTPAVREPGEPKRPATP
jgi:hypothetical protein